MPTAVKRLTAKRRQEIIEENRILRAQKLEMQEKYLIHREQNLIMFFDTPPYPGPNPKQAQVLEAFLDEAFKIFGMSGGNRLGKCVTYQTLIETPNGEISIGELYEAGKPFDVYSWDGEKKVLAKASAPFKKPGLHQCYRLEMSDGRLVEAADHHRLLTSHGWLSIQDVLCTYLQILRESNLGHGPLIHASDASRLSQKQSDCQGHCSENRHLHGERPLLGRDIFPISIPSPSDVQEHTAALSDTDVLESKYTNNLCLESALPSNQDVLSQTEDPSFESLCCAFCTNGKCVDGYTEVDQQSICEFSFHFESSNEFDVSPNTGTETLAALNTPFCLIGDNQIECITSIPALQEVYDFSVEKHHNYFAGGLIHHNTTLLTIVSLSVLFGEYLWNNTSLSHLFPHNRPRKVRYIGQGWQDHIKAVVIPELEKWWPASRPVQRLGNNIITNTWWKDKITGSTLEIMSNGQDPKAHEGWFGDLIVYDEPVRREIRTANARGLVDRRGRELFSLTMLGEPWIDREIIKKTRPDGKPDKSVFWRVGTSYDNVGYGITKEGIEEFKDKLTPGEIRTRIDGIPEYLQGLIYKFDRNIHLKPHFPIPLDWPVDIAIDIHGRVEQAVLFVATDPRNERFICDEIWEHGDGTQIGEAIVRKVKANAYRVNRVIVDPSSKGDSNNEETTFDKIFKVLAREGILLKTASKDLDAGIRSVELHLMGPNKMPSLFLLDNCRNTLREIEGYMWNEKNGKPIDKDDHMMENLYRICLLNTIYVDMDYEEAYVDSRNDSRSEMTGY